jgi:DNA segregation ATPase FtsK/SpoIIIE, S-DNA-T family
VATQRSSKKPAKRAPAKKGAHAQPTLWQRHERDIWMVVFFLVGVCLVLAEIGALGPVGRSLATALNTVFGVGRVALAVSLVGLAVALVLGKIEFDRARFSWGLSLLVIAVSGLGDLSHDHLSYGASSARLGDAGGWLGVAVGGTLRQFIGTAGAAALCAALFVVGVMFVTSIGLRALVAGTVALVRAVAKRFAQWWGGRPRVVEPEEPEEEPAKPKRTRTPEPQPEVEADEDPAPVELDDDSAYEPVYVEDLEEPEERPAPKPTPAVVASAPSAWTLPPMNLLGRTKEQRQDRDAIEAAGAELVEALTAHGVDTTLVGFTVGPTVTRYELELGPGVKVSRVTSLNRDIAYAMASPDVRILAPIPGRSAIGIEVPNRQRTLVVLGDLLTADEAMAATHPLDVPIGRDISGKTVVVNLGEMPHVLISGATGAGKSSCINSLITSLVMRADPDQLKLLLIDPKRVEMGQYNDLPHLIAPVVVDPKKAAGTLAWAVKEMERRYDILAESGARDITSYQQMIVRGELSPTPTIAEEVAEAVERATGLPSDVAPQPEPEQLPYIVIVVDELNDLMMVAARDVEESVVRIAQMARAVGIHLVLATQRPSVDVITGVIKANVPSRMAFAVSSLADSRVILDQAGAERLIGKGDMLLVTASSNIARRLQSPWVSEEEVRKVVENWKAQGGRRESVVVFDAPVRLEGSSSSGDDDDEILRQARELVIRTQSGSTSMLQRKLRVGFARAGRIMDQLEQEGIVAPGDGSKARKVLVTLDEYDPEAY